MCLVCGCTFLYLRQCVDAAPCVHLHLVIEHVATVLTFSSSCNASLECDLTVPPQGAVLVLREREREIKNFLQLPTYSPTLLSSPPPPRSTQNQLLQAIRGNKLSRNSHVNTVHMTRYSVVRLGLTKRHRVTVQPMMHSRF